MASVRDFAEVIIVDSGSTDETLDIAGKFANTRIFHHAWLGYAKQKQIALTQCTQPWALNLDGDEELSIALKEEIVKRIATDNVDGLVVPIRDVFMGRSCSQFAKFHAKVRFFRREKGSYDTRLAVHEGVQVRGRVEMATGVIHHYGEKDIATKVDKNNRYSTLKANEKAAGGMRSRRLKLLLAMPLAFIKSYVFRRNFFNGWPGFIGSLVNAFYAFLKEAKLYEQQARVKR